LELFAESHDSAKLRADGGEQKCQWAVTRGVSGADAPHA
jgi:hypothetical protein